MNVLVPKVPKIQNHSLDISQSRSLAMNHHMIHDNQLLSLLSLFSLLSLLSKK